LKSPLLISLGVVAACGSASLQASKVLSSGVATRKAVETILHDDAFFGMRSDWSVLSEASALSRWKISLQNMPWTSTPSSLDVSVADGEETVWNFTLNTNAGEAIRYFAHIAFERTSPEGEFGPVARPALEKMRVLRGIDGLAECLRGTRIASEAHFSQQVRAEENALQAHTERCVSAPVDCSATAERIRSRIESAKEHRDAWKALEVQDHRIVAPNARPFLAKFEGLLGTRFKSLRAILSYSDREIQLEVRARGRP
jgi:hypothetical protein